jgi:hypothetical protein
MVGTNPNRPLMNRRTCIYVQYQYLLNHTLWTVNEVLGILKTLWKMIISRVDAYHPPEDFFLPRTSLTVPNVCAIDIFYMKFNYEIIFSSSYLHESCWSRLSTVLFVASLPTALLQWIRVDQCHSKKKFSWQPKQYIWGST